MPLYGWVAQRLPRQRFLASVLLFFVGCIQLFYLGSRAGVPHLGFVFFVWVGIFSLTTVAQFWSYANEIYTPGRRAHRGRAGGLLPGCGLPERRRPVLSRTDEIVSHPLRRVTGLNERLSIQGWRVGEPRAEVSTGLRVARAGSFARFDVELTLERESSYHAWKLGVPLTLIVLMAYGVCTSSRRRRCLSRSAWG